MKFLKLKNAAPCPPAKDTFVLVNPNNIMSVTVEELAYNNPAFKADPEGLVGKNLKAQLVMPKISVICTRIMLAQGVAVMVLESVDEIEKMMESTKHEYMGKPI